MTHLLTLYARREPATMRPHMHVSPHGVPASKRDVVLYRDPQCQHQCSVYTWRMDSQPRRNSRKVMHNCYRFGLEWLDDLRCDASARAPSSRHTCLRRWS